MHNVHYYNKQMNFDKDPMQNTQTNQPPSQTKVKNTLSTSNSKGDTDIDNDQYLKNQRLKYLQSRLNRKQQIKQIRKKQFGSSSSESEDENQKNKQKPKIVKDTQMANKKYQTRVQSPTKNQQLEFHAKHQAYIKEKLARKQQLIEQRRKQFGSSSSDDSDDDKIQNGNNKNGIKLKVPTPSQSGKSSSKQFSQKGEPNLQSPSKKPLNQQTKSASKLQSGQPIVQQIVYTKGQNLNQAKKFIILVQSKKNQQWIEQTLIIQNKKIKFINLNLQFMIAYINKMKLFFTSVNKDFFKMKISHKGDDFIFAASITKTTDNLPDYYHIFSRIVQDKMILLGFQPKKNEKSIFPNYQNLKDAPQNLKSPQCFVYGNILKKSQVFGNWQTRFIYLNQKQIGSSKKPNQKPSMVILNQDINQLWTRFDIEQNNMLNIKIMYNSTTKTQFGIPLSNLTDQFNWLYCFYKAIAKNKKF